MRRPSVLSLPLQLVFPVSANNDGVESNTFYLVVDVEAKAR